MSKLVVCYKVSFHSEEVISFIMYCYVQLIMLHMIFCGMMKYIFSHFWVFAFFFPIIFLRYFNVLLCAVHRNEVAGLGGSVGCAVRLETRRSRVQPPPKSATFFHGD